jgi:hypothetical protein
MLFYLNIKDKKKHWTDHVTTDKFAHKNEFDNKEFLVELVQFCDKYGQIIHRTMRKKLLYPMALKITRKKICCQPNTKNND